MPNIYDVNVQHIGRECQAYRLRSSYDLPRSGIHSRRRAADELGVDDPDAEFSRWLEEQGMVGGG